MEKLWISLYNNNYSKSCDFADMDSELFIRIYE